MANDNATKHLSINWPVAVTAIAFMLMTCFMAALYANHIHWTALFEKVKDGCIDENNRMSHIKIVFDSEQLWSCTPFYTPTPAPRPTTTKRKRG